MRLSWSYFLFIVWFSYLIITSILLFSRGFLLTRDTQERNSSCNHYSIINCSSSKPVTLSKQVENTCLNEYNLSALRDSVICFPAKARVILIVIDALRYDFTVTDKDRQHVLPYQNKLPSIDRLRRNFPERSRLYKFIADPPTTTMQRLKGLTTGSLPTFIDAGSNFATSEINEDNIIDQMITHNQSIVFMGDDTWIGLYPRRFLRSYPYPSFNVWDLDTVDNGVNAHLYPEIKNQDWKLLIAHFLGVDHCGHRFGPNHSEMARKLTEMDAVIEKVINEMDNDTMLFVIGDHGMTTTGDHGGSSYDEVTSALFVYSKKRLSSFLMDIDTVKQVDIVPTLSTILGVPTPFSNLGNIILNAIPVVANDLDFSEWQQLLYVQWANVQQMIEYIKEYSRTSSVFSDDTLGKYYETFNLMNFRILQIKTEDEFQNFAKEAREFLIEIREMCEEVWVQFEPYSMTRGLVFLFLSIFLVYIIVDGIPIDRLSEIFVSSFIVCSYTSLVLAVIVAAALFYTKLVDDLLPTIFILTVSVSQFMLAILIIQNWETISLNWYDKSKTQRLTNFICRVVLAFIIFGLFSNSYIVEEGYVLLFCLISIIIISTLNLNSDQFKCKTVKFFSLKWSKLKIFAIAFGIALFVRLSMYFWRCREEQEWCFKDPHEYPNSLKLQTTKVQWMFSTVCISALVIAIKMWLRHCGNLNGFSVNVTFAKYLPTVVVVFISGFWALNQLPAETKNKLVKPWQSNILAWIIYSMSIIGFTTSIFQPLCTYIAQKNTELSVECFGNVIPQIFNHIRTLFVEKNKKTSQNEVMVYGLATVYSTAYVIASTYLVLVISLLLGSGTAPSAVIMFLTAVFVLVVLSVIRIENAENIDQLLEVPNVTILTWVIICQYFFYGSGHQPTFPNIHWEAAFVGVSGDFAYKFVPATLVMINTFCANILLGFLVPLLFIAPFTIFVMIPSVAITPRKNELFRNSNRGELFLSEKESHMVTAIFTACCKYIMCHGIRVLASMLSATIHCRHLMVWKIFAPKFIFESLGIFVTLIVVIFSYLFLIRISYKVNRFITALHKQYS